MDPFFTESKLLRGAQSEPQGPCCPEAWCWSRPGQHLVIVIPWGQVGSPAALILLSSHVKQIYALKSPFALEGF